MSTKEIRVSSYDHFCSLLNSGHTEFRMQTFTPGSNKRKISKYTPFDRNDPIDYVLVKLLFDHIEIYAIVDFPELNIAEA
jgi:hypothetical protein